MPLALLGVLAVGGLIVGLAFAKDSFPIPTISASPANPTNSQTASFTYTDSQAITRFQCSLDGSGFEDCGTTRPSSKTYPGPLAAGSHTFQVRAVSGSQTSSATSFSWVIDRTPPTVSSINRAGASPTNAGSVQWTLTFSESVSGVDARDFTLVPTGGVTGASISSVTPSGPANTYTVTASTGSGDGTLGLNLVDDDSIRDAATNPLGGPGAGNSAGQTYTIDKTPPTSAPTITSQPATPTNQSSAAFAFIDGEPGVTGFACKLDGGAYTACTSPKAYSVTGGTHTFSVEARDAAGNTGPVATYTWVVDTAPPPKPTITGQPPSPSSSSTATFTFADAEAGVSFSCKLDSGAWQGCTSPSTYAGLSVASHEFNVRAIDAAGNRSDEANVSWKVTASSGQPFTVSGNPTGSLYPGGVTRSVNLSLTNPNSVSISVTSLSISVQSVIAPNASPGHPCTVNDFAVGQFGGGYPFTVASGTSTLSQLGFSQTQWPSVWMLETGLNQDGCKGATVNLTYSGSAHS